MKDKGIKMLEKIKMLAGIYKRAGEKRSVAVKALSVVLVFAVVMANLSVPRMKVKAAETYTINVTMKFGNPNPQSISTVPYSEDKTMNSLTSSQVNGDSMVVFALSNEEFGQFAINSLNDSKNLLYTEYVVKYGENGTGPDVGLGDDNPAIMIDSDAFTGTNNYTVNVTLTAVDYRDLSAVKFLNNGNPIDSVKMIPNDNPIAMDEFRERVFIKYKVNVDNRPPEGESNAGLVKWVWQPDSNFDGFYSNGTKMVNPLLEQDVEYEYRMDLPYFARALDSDPQETIDIPITPVKKITVSAFYGLQTGQAALMSQSGTFSSVNYDSATNKWTIPITLAEVLPAGVNVNELKGWIVSTTTPLPTGVEIPLKSESYNNNRYIDYDTSTRTVNLTVDNDYALNPEGYEGLYFNAVVGSIDNSNSEKIAVNISYKFEHQYGEYYYAGIPYNYIYNIEIDRPSSPGTDPNFSSGEYYEFTIPESELRSIPVFKSANSSNDSTSYYAKGFTLKMADSGKMDVDQTISLGGGNQTIQIDKSFFNSQTTYDVDLHVIASSNMTKTIQKQSAGGSSKAFPLTKIEKDDDDNLYGVYNVTVPSVSEWETLYFPENYTSGIVGTNVHLDVDSVIVKDQNEATVSDKNLEQGGTYKFLVPYNSLDTTSAFYISSSPVLKLPVNFNAGSDGTLTSDANKTYTSTQLNENTGEWTLSLETPGVEVSDSSKEFKGWKVPQGFPEAIGVNSNNGGYLVQNTVLTIPNEYAQSVSPNYSLTFTADYTTTAVDVNVTYNAGINGKITGTDSNSVSDDYSFGLANEGIGYYYDPGNDIPAATGNNGYIFMGWEPDTSSHINFNMLKKTGYERYTVPTKGDFELEIYTDDIVGQSNLAITLKAAYKHSAMTLSRSLGTGAGTGSTVPGNVTLYPVDYTEGTGSTTGKFKYTLDLPAVTPADGYTFTGYKLTQTDYVITNENGEAVNGDTLLTGTTATVYIAESASPSTDQISLTATAQFTAAPQLKISFENGGNVSNFNAMSANADSNGNYTYEVTLPGASGGMILTWTPGTIRTTGAANTVTYQVYRQATDTTALADNAEIYSGDKVYIKANVTEDTPAATWAPGGDPMVGGTGVFTVTFNNGVAFIAPGNWTWTIIEEDNEFEYTVNSQTKVRIYTNPSTTSLQFNMRSN